MTKHAPDRRTRVRMIAGFCDLAVWMIRSGPSGERTWLIEASLIGVKGLDASIKRDLATKHFMPMMAAVIEEKLRAEENGAERIEFLERVAGSESRRLFDELRFVPGFSDPARGE